MKCYIHALFCLSVLLLASCTFNRRVHSENGVYGEVVLYDTHFIDEYIGTIRMELVEENGQVRIKNNAPDKPNFAGYRLFATYDWEKPEITYHSAPNIDYTIQAQLHFFLYFEDDKYEFISVPRYNATIMFTKIRGNNRLQPQIISDGIKGNYAIKPQFIKQGWPFQGDYVLELRPF